MNSSFPALSSGLSDQFFDTVEMSNPLALQVESASRKEPNADALYGPGGKENMILRMESQDIISVEMARSELEPLERDARYALSYQDQPLKIAVREYERQARDAVSQAVRESSESYEVMMMQEIQGVLNRYEGRMEENERRVAQVIGSNALDAPRGQRSHMLLEHLVLLQVGERKRVREEPGALGATVTHGKLSKMFT